MSKLLQDLRYGARLWARSPGFTAVAVLTLALGIGANSAVFSIVRGLLLEPLPFRDPDRLVLLWEASAGGQRTPVALPNFADWRAEAKSFSALAAYRGDELTLSGGAAEPQRVRVAFVTSDLFATLGMTPAMVRGIPLTCMSRPITERSAPKLRRQRP